MAMWTLTKMAMLFFIIALSLIIMSFAGRERQSLCINRAQAVASGVGSAIAQVINSPLEDERTVYPLESVLTVGQSDYERYYISITNHSVEPGSPDSPYMVVEVTTDNPNCGAGTKVGFPKELKVSYISSNDTIKIGGIEFKGMTLTPSKPDLPDPAPKTRSKYVTIIRCQSKHWPPDRSLFIQDCKQPDSAACLSFNATDNDISDACQWPVTP